MEPLPLSKVHIMLETFSTQYRNARNVLSLPTYTAVSVRHASKRLANLAVTVQYNQKLWPCYVFSQITATGGAQSA